MSAATAIAGVIGDPIDHSLSPALHNAAFESLGMDWVFLAFPVPSGQAAGALAGVRALGIRGLSVTMPHKEAVAQLVDQLSDRALRLQAVNAVLLREDRSLFGDSTDGAGFLADLRLRAGVDPEGLRCMVLGAGGAARAVVLALAEAGAEEVVVVNRSGERARRAAALAGERGRVGSAKDLEECDLVVNATPVGMGEAAPLSYPADPLQLGAGQLAVDLVYHPLSTPFLRAAREAGAETLDGLGMLTQQAGLAFRLWTGQEPPIDVMEQAALRALSLTGA